MATSDCKLIDLLVDMAVTGRVVSVAILINLSNKYDASATLGSAG